MHLRGYWAKQDFSRAKAQGKALFRPPALSRDQQHTVRKKLLNGETISTIARQMGTNRQTIMHVRDQK